MTATAGLWWRRGAGGGCGGCGVGSQRSSSSSSGSTARGASPRRLATACFAASTSSPPTPRSTSTCSEWRPAWEVVGGVAPAEWNASFAAEGYPRVGNVLRMPLDAEAPERCEGAILVAAEPTDGTSCCALAWRAAALGAVALLVAGADESAPSPIGYGADEEARRAGGARHEGSGRALARRRRGIAQGARRDCDGGGGGGAHG